MTMLFSRSFIFLLSITSFVFVTGCNTFVIPRPAVRVVTFGDSTTAGPSEKDYIEFLPELLDLPEEAFSNEGRGGERADEGSVRLVEILESGAYPNAEILIFWEGGNDVNRFLRRNNPLLTFAPNNSLIASRLNESLDDIENNIERAVVRAKQEGMTVYLCTYFFLREVTDFGNCPALLLDSITAAQARNANMFIDLLNDRIREVASRNRVFVIDVETENEFIRSSASHYENCNHMSASGNEFVAGLVADELKKRPLPEKPANRQRSVFDIFRP